MEDVEARRNKPQGSPALPAAPSTTASKPQTGPVVLLSGVPANPPTALAYQLQQVLGLGATPLLIKQGRAGARCFLRSGADGATALAAGSAQIFGVRVGISATPAATKAADLRGNRIDQLQPDAPELATRGSNPVGVRTLALSNPAQFDVLRRAGVLLRSRPDPGGAARIGSIVRQPQRVHPTVTPAVTTATP